MTKAMMNAIAVLLMASSTSAADVQLTLQNGRVSLVVKDATVRQVLEEWARVGQMRVVNVERIPDGRLTLELSDVREAEALDVLLRSLSGYLARARPTGVDGVSQYDLVIVLPAVAPPQQRAAAFSPVAAGSPAPSADTVEQQLSVARGSPAGVVARPTVNVQPAPNANLQNTLPQSGSPNLPTQPGRIAPVATAASPSQLPTVGRSATTGAVSVPGMIAPVAMQPIAPPPPPNPQPPVIRVTQPPVNLPQ